MSKPVRARATAPGSIGNVGPGLDVLGLAVDGAGDTVVAEVRREPGIVVAESGHPDLTCDPLGHASAIAAQAVLDRAGFGGGLLLRCEKGLPLAGGQGGSAASAVAGAVVANALTGARLGVPDLLAAALEAEWRLAGRHLDNVAPSLLGGLAVVRSLDPIDVAVVPVPERLHVVLALPDQRLRTAEGRAALPESLSRELAVHQMAQTAAIVAACAAGDLALLGRAIDDRIAEPAREPMLPGFAGAKAAAIAAGALGASISGSGPTAFALTDGAATAEAVASAMAAAYRAAGFTCTVRTARPDRRGAVVTLLA